VYRMGAMEKNVHYSIGVGTGRRVVWVRSDHFRNEKRLKIFRDVGGAGSLVAQS